MSHAQPRQSKVRNDASIVDGSLYFEDARQCAVDDELFSAILDEKTTTAIRVVSLSHSWYQTIHYDYLNGVKDREDINVEMTIRKERRGQFDHWYAYRRVHGKLHKRYVGYSEDITEARLLEVAQNMPSR